MFSRHAPGVYELPSAAATVFAQPLFRVLAFGTGVLALLAAGWLFPGASRAGSGGLDTPPAFGCTPARSTAREHRCGSAGLTFVDRTRVARFHTGAVTPRTLVTQIRYPAVGPPGANDLRDAAPLSTAGPFR